MVLVQKWPFFNLFFWGNIGQENIFYDILKRKNAFLGYKNRKFKKSKNWHFSKGVHPWFCAKMAIFQHFLLRQYREEKCLLRYSSTKKRNLYAIKTKSLKCRIIEIFLKGLTHGFGQNMAIFQPFLLWQYRPGKCLLRYSRTKKRLFTL